MRQSNAIFGALLIAFVIYIAVKGSLPVYLEVLFGSVSDPQQQARADAGKQAVSSAGSMAPALMAIPGLSNWLQGGLVGSAIGALTNSGGK